MTALDPRVPRVLGGFALLTVAVVLLGLSAGSYPLGMLDAGRALLGLETTDPGAGFVVRGIRLPRMMAALMVGCALGVAGTILQGLTRNVLAAPSVLGITQSASLFVVGAIVLLPTLASGMVAMFAFGGATLAAVLIYAFGWRDGLSSNRIVLVGIGITATATAMITFLLTFGEVHRIERALVWMIGSVYGKGWVDLVWLLPWLLIGLPAAVVGGRALDVLALGDDVATGIGSRVLVVRIVLLMVAVGLVGSAVATAGAVAFVGLMAPHAARQLVGPAHVGVVLTSGLLGGVIVAAADLVARTAMAPTELPCGVVTAVLGAPFFVYLLVRRTI